MLDESADDLPPELDVDIRPVINGIEYKFKDLFGTNVGEFIQNGSTVRSIGTAQNYFDLYYQSGKNTAVNPIPIVEEGIYFAGGGAGKGDRVGQGPSYGGLGGGGSGVILSLIHI